MKKLLKSEVNVLSNYIYNRARDLEIARYNFHFLNGSKNDVLHALTIYQNRDGGFGHGIEPDCLNPYSNPIQTYVALGILNELGYTSENLDEMASHMVERALHYIYFYEFKNEMINPCVPTNNDYPRANWWDYIENFFPVWRYNPTSGIIAFTLLLSKKGNKYYEKAYNIVPKLIEYFVTHKDHDKYQLRGFIEIYDVIIRKNLFPELQAILLTHINFMIDLLIEKNQNKWDDSQANRPLDLLILPVLVNSDKRKELLNQNLDYLIDCRNNNGTYDVTWTWRNHFTEFELQRVKWQGILAIDNLLELKNHGRIEK